MGDDRTAVVTGGNRGVGLAVVQHLLDRGFVTVLACRDTGRGEAAAATLTPGPGRVLVRRLDVGDDDSVRAFAAGLTDSPGRVDVLVNNAGIHYDTDQDPAGADVGVVREAFEVNALGALKVCQAVLPLMRHRGPGRRIVNVSSGAGSLSTMGAGTPAYAISKAALNAVTRLFAAQLAPDGILVNSVCPGWVATDMGGRGGRPVAEGAAGVVWAVDLPDDGPTGGFFREGRPVPW
ncbi:MULTISPECIES: SDR family NAD(P)-dependent oxidoreductase [unclassified Micromonospora]|uniref:SDR family NAD(P)-dependent oxidoreductase n=1 Tax=unclassified Micromonospora TaxID=2617518 RepID=UPI002FEF58F6